jgi:hypothetical protein
MESSPLQRRVTFALIVLVLVGLGIYLIGVVRGPGARGASPAGRRPTLTIPPSPTPSAAAPGSSAAPNIYQWLPFTQPGLTAAASVARQFGAAYGTFSYTQTATAYAASFKSLASADLTSQIMAAYSTPGVAAARTSTRQVSAGTAVIQAIRAFGPTSLTFLVQITQNLTATTGSSQDVTQYAVTVTGSGSTWQVTDIELASAGNS